MVLDHTAFSPKPVEHKGTARTMTFLEAMKEMLEGSKITRLEWNSNEEYGYIKDGLVIIHTRGEDHKWIIRDGDYLANDWVILPI